MTQDFDPCHMTVAHGPHRWDTEERTSLRFSCPGLVFPETEATQAGRGTTAHVHGDLTHSHPGGDEQHAHVGYYSHPATGEQPETQLATDLVRAEATIARVRALFATGEDFDGGGYEPCGPNPTDCDHAECDTARAVLEALDGPL